jgi:hypothetical protein
MEDKMKRILIAVFLVALLCGISFAGESRTTPEYLVLSEPTTNEVEFLTLTHYYSATNPYAIVTLHVLDSNGVRDSVSVIIRNISDDPDTDLTLCTDVDIPFDCCTGAYPGDSNEDCDETDPVYTDFVFGYGATMKSRADVLSWGRLQELYPTQATP